MALADFLWQHPAERLATPPSSSSTADPRLVMDRAACVWRWAATTFVGVCLVVHFAATVVHVGPLNPLQLRYGQQASDYLSPYFEQNWSLFAPDPIASERGILVRARLDTGETSEWFDIASAANADARSRLLLSPRTSRIISNGLAMYLTPDPLRAVWIERAEERDIELDPSALELTPEERAFQERAEDLLHRRLGGG